MLTMTNLSAEQVANFLEQLHKYNRAELHLGNGSAIVNPASVHDYGSPETWASLIRQAEMILMYDSTRVIVATITTGRKLHLMAAQYDPSGIYASTLAAIVTK